MVEQRLIDANILWHNVDKVPCILDDNNGWLVKRSSVIAKIEDAPTVEAKPVVHAHWKHHMQCSECGQVDTTEPNFCPHCGAQMDEKED